VVILASFHPWDKKTKQIIHLPNQAEFLHVKLIVTNEQWQVLNLNGWAKTKTELFFYNGNKWKYGSPDSIVFGFGYIIAEDLQLDTTINPAKDVTSRNHSQNTATLY
jgi:hypothetical protein